MLQNVKIVALNMCYNLHALLYFRRSAIMVFLNWKILKVVLLDFSVLFWPNNCTWQTKVQKKKILKKEIKEYSNFGLYFRLSILRYRPG